MVDAKWGWVGAAAVALLLSLPSWAAPATAPLPPLALAIGATTAVPSVPWKGFDSNPPKLYDLDGDGDLELFAQNDNTWVYVFDTRTGGLLAEVNTTLPKGWNVRSFNGPEVAVLEPGSAPRLVVANSAATVAVFRYDAAHSTSHHAALVKEWERKLDDCHKGSGMDAKPVLADLDHDGDLDILAATEDFGVFALRADGSELWKTCIVGGNAEPAVGDLDLDGWEEVVFGSDLGMVNVLDGRTGQTKWQVDLTQHFDLSSGSMPNAITLGQVDGQGGPDLLLGARDSHDPDDWSNDHALLAAIRSDGTLLWGRQDPIGNPLTYTHPLLVDADGDGTQEIYWADWNTVGHYPPFNESQMWALTGPAHVYRYDLSGRMVWRQTLGTWWSNKDLVVVDADGDGTKEVLANGPNAVGNHDGLWFLDLKTGAKKAFLDLYPWKVGRSPVVGDLYGTGTLQFVVEAAQHSPTSNGPAFLVYDTQVGGGSASGATSSTGTSAATSTAATAATTSSPPSPTPPRTAPGGLNLEGLRALRKASSSSAPDPPPGTPGAAGPLHVTFEAKPLPPFGLQATARTQDGRALARVEVRAGGGDWQPMAPTPWGPWVAWPPSAGPLVFRATDAAGAVAESPPMPWSAVAPAGPEFTATFEPVAGPMAEWWIEARVEATAPVAQVLASVGDGPTLALRPTTWGTWALSVHVPPGVPVHLEARADDGQAVRWTAPDHSGR
jgi:outer membrane protein assembly factor BamB